MANEQGQAQSGNRGLWLRIVILRCITSRGVGVSLLEKSTIEGESPIHHLLPPVHGVRSTSHAPRDWSAKWVVNFI
jgi:hypothetical protein